MSDSADAVIPRARVALCPGTYDPVTYGHLDIIERAARIFDQVVVAVIQGGHRKHPLFTAEERQEFVRVSVAHLDNVQVQGFNSLVIEHARRLGALVVVKGLRAISDFDYEFQMAQINRHLAPEVETVYLPASPHYSFLSSSGVREVAEWGGSVDDWVPPHVAEAFRARREGTRSSVH
jgi:pantetheine-phosphate adenylyltransferase